MSTITANGTNLMLYGQPYRPLGLNAYEMATSGAVDGQETAVLVYDFSAAAETIGWTNTENSTVSAPTTSNGSTTLPKTVTFQFNGATSKWRCIASV